MFKSLYSGVSGLGANLTNLDVIGNNIANSNTVGFKSGRVTFNEMLTQTMKSASRPVSGGLGGTNPQQIGLGTMVGSIDTNFNQGNFQTTGKKTDLAIQGPGFFVLSDGNSRVYTRAGVFGLDSENQLVNPATGLRVQGLMADATGNIVNGPLDDIFIDPALVVPAQPSSMVQLMGNLDSASDAKGSVTRSPSFLVAADGADLLTELSSASGGDMGLNAGQSLAINGRAGGVAFSAAPVTITEGMTMQQFVTAVNSSLAAAVPNPNLTVSIGADGSLAASNGGAADVDGLSLGTAFAFSGTIASGASGSSNAALAYAGENDLLVNLRNAQGASLGLEVSAGTVDLSVGGEVGGTQVAARTLAVDGSTTLAQMMQEIQYALGVNSNPVELNDEGQIIVRGEVGTAAAIGPINVTQVGAVNAALDNAFEFTGTQSAEDQKTFSMTTNVYDSLGGQHTVSFAFEKVPGQNEWIWNASMGGNETILSGGSGRMRFSESGAISGFSFADGSTSLTFQPQAAGLEGAANVRSGHRLRHGRSAERTDAVRRHRHAEIRGRRLRNRHPGGFQHRPERPDHGHLLQRHVAGDRPDRDGDVQQRRRADPRSQQHLPPQRQLGRSRRTVRRPGQRDLAGARRPGDQQRGPGARVHESGRRPAGLPGQQPGGHHGRPGHAGTGEPGPVGRFRPPAGVMGPRPAAVA